jgi:NAD(P)-dependent dehydrogenase (short-subunit alcohol dehydrogenase family)
VTVAPETTRLATGGTDMTTDPTLRLDGKLAIVTGASRGIGAAIAKKFAQAGARLVLVSRKREGLEAVASEIRAGGGTVAVRACHVGKIDEVEALVPAVLAEHGQIDILVNNAGTNPYFGPLMNFEWAAWDKTFEVNLKGPAALARAVAQHLMQRQAPGAIINVTSILGTTAAPMQGIYGMTKAALVSLTQTLAVELGGFGIRVNAIAPGVVDTKLASLLVNDPGISKQVLDRTPLRRIGQPDDIAGAALFLASDAARYVTGHTLVVDGGWTAG